MPASASIVSHTGPRERPPEATSHTLTPPQWSTV